MSCSLKEPGYSKPATREMMQNESWHPDRDEQFRFINDKAHEFIDASLSDNSTDTKTRELVGSFENGGAKYNQVKDPGKVPNHDTSAFAAETANGVIVCKIQLALFARENHRH